MFIVTNEVEVPYCLECERNLCNDANAKEKPCMQKKYIRQQRLEMMSEFMKEGGTYQKYMSSMLYHTFLVVMLGSTVLAKSVEEEVQANDFNLMFRRDHSERYTPRQTGEIIAEGIGTDGNVSIEGATLLFKVLGADSFWKILYASLSDGKHQNAHTIRCNIEHALNDLDIQGEMKQELLNAIFDIVDGCAVQYRCATVLFIFAQLAIQLNVPYTRTVQAPGHGKEEVDGIIGGEKTYLDMIFACPGLYGEEDDNDTKAPMHHMD
jgi:hypothetical protein